MMAAAGEPCRLVQDVQRGNDGNDGDDRFLDDGVFDTKNMIQYT